MGKVLRASGAALLFILAVAVSNVVVESTQALYARLAGPGRFVQRVDAALADNVTGNGSYYQVDGAFNCLSGGKIIFCNPITGTVNIAATAAMNFSNDLTSGTGMSLSNALGGTLNTTTHPELGFLNSNVNTGANGCPDTGLGASNVMFQVANSANTAHAFNISCAGVVGIGGSMSSFTMGSGAFITTGSAANPFLTCPDTSGCGESFAATSAPGMVWDETGPITGANVNFEWMGGASGTTVLATMAGNGNYIQVIGNTTNSAGDIVDTAGNFVANGVANATGEIRSGGAANVTGAKGIGAVVMGGMPYSGTFCSVANGTTTNASPSAWASVPTTGQWNCPVTSGSAAATVFNLLFPGSVTLTNAGTCLFTTSLASAVEPIVTSSTTQCTLTYAVAPGATLLGRLIMMGNGP